MKLFKGLDIDKFTKEVMSDPRWEGLDINDDLKQYITISYARGFNNAYDEKMGKCFLIGMFIGAILCAVGSAIGESIKSRKK